MDGLLRGGYRTGRIVEFLGRSGTGKTQFAMQAALCASRQGVRSLFVDTEGSFRPERIRQMAEARGWSSVGVLESIVYLRTDSFAEQMEVVSKMKMKDATSGCSLVVVDTLTKNFTLGLPGRSNMGERQGVLRKYLSEIARDAFLNERAYLLTNRVTFGALNDVAIGGLTVQQMVHESVLLEKGRGIVRATSQSRGESVSVSLSVSGAS